MTTETTETTRQTPGPWAAHDLHGLKGRVVRDIRGRDIAHVYTTDNTEANRAANARLIAAAPEMLAMLQRGQDVREQMLAALGAGQNLLSSDWIALDRDARALLRRLEP